MMISPRQSGAEEDAKGKVRIPRSSRDLPILEGRCSAGSPAEFGKLIAKVIRAANIKPE
jgi:hypothetical protein